ncbi:TonB-dependent receptor domain-containing protein [Vibrio fluminensis]|uniref:TonB-dependent receptor domain-containing protein n=1 Tax=Vibrio fluminensis TaxID=2783614 RepID=UPI0018896B5F|nr:TonB-dependent receptor [Vibrio fluminensis]
MNRSILAVTVGSLLSYAPYSLAETADETVVVTANRFEQPIQDVTASITVIDRHEIEDIQAKSIVDILKRVPGIEITQNGGRGQNASIYMRGYNSDQVLVLVDGVRIQGASGGVSFNYIPVNLIEQVEVIRGASSALYGSDAIAGVINIITKSTVAKNGAQASIGAGSDSQREGSFVAEKVFENEGSLKFAGGYESTDGFDIIESGTGMDFGYENQNLYAAYSNNFTGNFFGNLSVMWIDSLSQYNQGGKYYNSTKNLSITGDIEYRGENLSSVFRLNQQAIESIEYSQAQGPDNAGTVRDIDLTTVQFFNLYDLNESVNFGAGADWRREELSKDSMGWGLDSLAGDHRDTMGAYLSSDATFGGVQLTGAVRHDKHDEYDSYNTWSLGGAYHFNENHQVRVNIGTSFKAPSYADLSNNPDLDAEEGLNREIGYLGEYELFSLELSVYDNDVDNLIIWYEGSPWYPLNVDAELRGVEVIVGFDTAMLSHTLIAEFKDHQDSSGTKLAKRADENFKWLVDGSYGDFDFNVTYTYTGERLGSPKESYDPENIMSSLSLWDVSVGYWISSDLVVRGRVDNLMDKEYQTSPGYNAPERRFFVNATMQF